MPPSAAVEYDTHLANDMMDELNLSAGSAVKRAILALFLCGLGAAILIAMLSYNPFDTTFDTAGIGETQNALGPIGAGSSNLIMQVIGWGGILLGGLTLFTGIRGIFKPRPKSTGRPHCLRFQFLKAGLWQRVLGAGWVTVFT